MPRAIRYQLRGSIISAGFASGDRFVLGTWQQGPVGPMNDIMWARPDGTRVLLAPDSQAAAFIAAVYLFDDVIITPVQVEHIAQRVLVNTDEVTLEYELGRRLPIPLLALRPPWLNRWVEGPIARTTMGINTYGRTDRGVEEWYRATSYRSIRQGRATLGGQDLGALGPLDPPLRVGLSEPPKNPSAVEIQPMLRDRSGELDRVIRQASATRPLPSR